MADRLSPLDASFLYMEDRTTPMHVGGVVIFDAPEGGFDYEQLVRLISERLSLVPLAFWGSQQRAFQMTEAKAER